MIRVLKILGNYILSLIAVMLFVLIHFVNFFVQIAINLRNSAVLEKAGRMAFEDAYLIDVMGAKVYSEFWNATCVKKDGFLFSKDLDWTISYMFKINYNQSTLTWLGYFIYILILICDFTNWFNGGHFKNTNK